MLDPIALCDISLGFLDGPLQLAAFGRALEVFEGFDREEHGDPSPFTCKHHWPSGRTGLLDNLRYLTLKIGERTEVFTEVDSGHLRSLHSARF